MTLARQHQNLHNYNSRFLPSFLLIVILILINITAVANDDKAIINVELILFSQPEKKYLTDSKEYFPEYPGELNLTNILPEERENLTTNTELKELVVEYNKLQQNSNYKILLYTTKQYNLIPTQKFKKLFFKTENFNSTLTIAPIPNRKNYFSVSFDGIHNNNRLTKNIKTKIKETLYLDHPKFGVLINLS